MESSVSCCIALKDSRLKQKLYKKDKKNTFGREHQIQRDLGTINEIHQNNKQSMEGKLILLMETVISKNI